MSPKPKAMKRDFSLIDVSDENPVDIEKEEEEEIDLEMMMDYGLPKWLKKPEKVNIINTMNGKYTGISIVKNNVKHGQSSSYTKITIAVEDHHELFETNFVSCDLCLGIYKSNGGHLIRHRDESCKGVVRDNNTSQVVLPKYSSKSEFDAALVEYFTRSAKPLYMLENPEFKELVMNVAKIGQRFHGDISESIVVKRSAARIMVENSLNDKTAEIMKLIAPYFEDKTISILADFGKLDYDFLSVKCGLLQTELDENGTSRWKLVIVPLAMAPCDFKSKDAENVFKAINSSVEKCSPTADTKDFFLIADGGSNIRSAGNVYFYKYVRCAAHASEIIGKRMLKPYKKDMATESHKKVLQKYIDVMENCRLLTLALKSDKLEFKKLGISLTVPVETRWMTSYTCASQVYQNLNILIAQSPNLISKAERLILDLSKSDSRKLFEELDEIYKSLKEVNDFFQKNSTTIAEVVPVYLGLLDEIERLAAVPTSSKNKKILLSYASKAVRKQINDLVDTHYLAYYLHPEYKDLIGLQIRCDHHTLGINVKQLVDSAVKDIDTRMNDDLPNSTLSSTSSVSSSSAGDSFFSRHMKKSFATDTKCITSERITYEMDSTTNDPRYYWPESKNRFPKLYKIAQKVFSTPASEAEVERSFSTLKNVYSDKRRCLNLDYLQKMMLVKQFEDLGI